MNEGRTEAYRRMAHEAVQRGGAGITGVTNELTRFHGNVEFLSIGSCVHKEGHPPGEAIGFSSSADGQELCCQLDCGFQPKQFDFGNLAYSVGAAGGIIGTLKSMGRGEVKEFSDVFNPTRHICLERIVEGARQAGANAVAGIETRIM